MEKIEQILRNPPYMDYPNGLNYISGKQEYRRVIDYPFWLSQLREAVKKLIPELDECYCKQYPGEPSCIDKKQQLCAACFRNTAINQINQSLDKAMGVGK